MSGTHSIIGWYQQLIDDNILLADSAQFATVNILHDFATTLQNRPPDTWRNRLKNRFKNCWGDKTTEPYGIYIHGGVGRGKSFLMDGFYLNLPIERKLRVHFHQFMRHLHADMKANEHKRDPLLHVARALGKRYDLICFDEFHVSDITDAMLLGRLLKTLFATGVRFVMTSNYAPADLYPNGLARDRFLPTIALLQKQLQIVALDSGNDYRRRLLADQPAYFSPWQEASCQQEMQTIFDRLACGITLKNTIKLNGRTLAAVARSSDCIWFDFDTLCQQARAQADYLQLAERFATVFMSAVPALNDPNLTEAARRFTWLVDILYDAQVRLVLGAEVALPQLYGNSEGGESGRTLSRLLEMQSSTYANNNTIIEHTASPN